MTSWTDPFHPLIVVTRHHHDTPGCPGHAEPDECTEQRTTNILEHPDDCRDLHSAAFPYRCMTQQDVELGEAEVPVDTGVYRVRATGSGHGDDADRGFDVETVTPAAARAAWLALATAPDPRYDLTNTSTQDLNDELPAAQYAADSEKNPPAYRRDAADYVRDAHAELARRNQR